MKLRYTGTCRICDVAIPARTEAVYERATKTVRCLAHIDASTEHTPAIHEPAAEPLPTEIGVPGASARRESDRRRKVRRQRVRAQNPKLAGLILALSEDPQSTKAWHAGAVGEERLGNRLNELSNDTLRVLHDRRIPRTRANIDHLAVTPTGIWVIDAKKYKGRPALKVRGGIFRRRVENLHVGSRDRTNLVDGMLRQVDVVEGVLLPGGRPEGSGRPWGGVPVRGILCFVEADWPLIGGAFTIRGVDVMWPKKLYPLLQTAGPLRPAEIAEIHRHLAERLPPA